MFNDLIINLLGIRVKKERVRNKSKTIFTR